MKIKYVECPKSKIGSIFDTEKWKRLRDTSYFFFFFFPHFWISIQGSEDCMVKSKLVTMNSLIVEKIQSSFIYQSDILNGQKLLIYPTKK